MPADRPPSPGQSVVRTRVKICGITRGEDAAAACAAGADALGFVCWDGSPRHVAPERIAALVAQLPPLVTTVALFVDPAPALVQAAIAAGCDLLQFHGDEPPEFCAGFGRPWIKAIRVGEGVDVNAAVRRYGAARGVLLDTLVQGVPGGTGQKFDWSRVPRDCALPVILAGGLTPANVGDAIRAVRPYAVDVSGGVEATRGIKDHARINAFLEGVRRVDQQD